MICCKEKQILEHNLKKLKSLAFKLLTHRRMVFCVFVYFYYYANLLNLETENCRLLIIKI
jgi:hypothetical protein